MGQQCRHANGDFDSDTYSDGDTMSTLSYDVEFDDFEREFDKWIHMLVDHQATIYITKAGERFAVMVPWEQWQEYLEMEAKYADTD